MIKWTDDLVPPAIVAAADILTTEQKPTWNRPVGIGMAIAGYVVGGVMGIGGNFVKNIGIASAPWAFEQLYLLAKEKGVISQVQGAATLQMRPSRRLGAGSGIGRWPAPATAPEFAFVPLD